MNTIVDADIPESSSDSDSSDEESNILNQDTNMIEKKVLETVDSSTDSSSDDEGLNIKKSTDNGSKPDKIINMTIGNNKQIIRFCYYKENDCWYLCQNDVKSYCGLRKDVSLFTNADLKKITEGKKTSILDNNKKTRSITVVIEIIIDKLVLMNKKKLDSINRRNTALLIKFLHLKGLHRSLLKRDDDYMNLKKEKFDLTPEEEEEVKKIDKDLLEIEESTKDSNSKKKIDKDSKKKNSIKKPDKNKKKRKVQSNDSDGNNSDNDNHPNKKTKSELDFNLYIHVLRYSFTELPKKDAKKLTKKVKKLSEIYSLY